MQVTVHDLVLFHFQGGIEPSQSRLSSPSFNLTRGLRLDGYLECAHATLHSQTSMYSPMFEPSTYSTEVNFTNHYNFRIAFVSPQNAMLMKNLSISNSTIRRLLDSRLPPGIA
ncbi:hypothetical protein TNCV_2949261 [Trichonephila clavipes]|nr:hypothetical protein TNCV_2949261 [Trichonephila clavipes]